jgi:hypothetical protein
MPVNADPKALFSDFRKAQTESIENSQRREQLRQQSNEFYVENNWFQIVVGALALVCFGALVLWLSECAQREERVRTQAIALLRKYGRDTDDMRDDNIRRAVLQAEDATSKSLLFAIACRVVNDSFVVTAMTNYEGPFRRALEGALQQDWFMAALCLTVIVGFILSAVFLIYMACTPRLWCSGGRRVRKLVS